MKSNIYTIGVIAIILTTLMGCKKYLDRDLTTDLTYKEVTTSYTYSRSRLASIYSDLKLGFLYIDGAMMASAGDEAEHTLETSAVQQFNVGSWNAYSNPDDVWAAYYKGIRKVNQFLVSTDSINLDLYKLDPSPTQQEVYKSRLEEINRWKYEARFLRAFFYFELVKRYGGVPVLTTADSIQADYSEVKRNALSECIDFITNESDSAASVLPVTYSSVDLGRATKGAALALKSRVLLYAASDLFNTVNWAGGYGNKELISLTGKSRQERWMAAANAAKAVIELADAAGYRLSTSYSSLFGTATFTNTEVIFCGRAGNTNTFEKASYSIGYDLGQSGTTPSQNLVNAYEMKNGKAITDPNAGYDSLNPYVSRDPRLAMSIITNNSVFKGRPVETWEGGRDGEPIPEATRTGYYLRKYVNQDLNLITNATSVHSWIYFRLSEIYLNYAEALNEYVPGNTDIKQYVDLVRQRPGVDMPGLPTGLGQAQVRDLIRNERRVEFAFEGHRFWDVRRWMQAPAALGTPLRGIQITKKANGVFSYQEINVENRVFTPKMYFYPLPQNELYIARNLIQNPLW